MANPLNTIMSIWNTLSEEDKAQVRSALAVGAANMGTGGTGGGIVQRLIDRRQGPRAQDGTNLDRNAPETARPGGGGDAEAVMRRIMGGGTGGAGGAGAVDPTLRGAPNNAAAGVAGGGGNSTIQGRYLLADEDEALNQTLRGMGYDPTRGGRMAEFMQQTIAPELKNYAQLMAYANGGTGRIDHTAIGQNFANLGRQFTTPGVDAYAGMQSLGNSVMSNPAFQQQLAGLNNPDEQMQWLQRAQRAQMAGAHPLAAGALGDQTARLANQFRTAEFNALGNPAADPGLFYQWLLTQDPGLRGSLFPGLR